MVGVTADGAAEECGPAGDDGAEEGVQGLAADPRLNAEPAAGDEGAHQGRQVRAVGSIGGPRENREGNSILRSRMRVQQNRREHDRVAKQDRNKRLPPVHAGADQSRRKHVSRDAVRHADPQRGVVVGSPVALGDLDGRQIVIEQRAPADFGERIGLKLDAAVTMLNCFVLIGQGLI